MTEGCLEVTDGGCSQSDGILGAWLGGRSMPKDGHVEQCDGTWYVLGAVKDSRCGNCENP